MTRENQTGFAEGETAGRRRGNAYQLSRQGGQSARSSGRARESDAADPAVTREDMARVLTMFRRGEALLVDEAGSETGLGRRNLAAQFAGDLAKIRKTERTPLLVGHDRGDRDDEDGLTCEVLESWSAGRCGDDAVRVSVGEVVVPACRNHAEELAASGRWSR